MDVSRVCEVSPGRFFDTQSFDIWNFGYAIRRDWRYELDVSVGLILDFYYIDNLFQLDIH